MNTREVLSSIAKASKSLVRPYHGNFPQDGGEMFAGARLRIEGLLGEVYITQTRVIFEIRQVEPSLFFSINCADNWHHVSEEINLSTCKLILYESVKSSPVNEWVFSGNNRELLKALQLLPDEYLHVYGNGLWLSVSPQHNFENILRSLSAMVRALPVEPEMDYKEGVNELPESLRPLSKYFKSWAISEIRYKEQFFLHIRYNLLSGNVFKPLG